MPSRAVTQAIKMPTASSKMGGTQNVHEEPGRGKSSQTLDEPHTSQCYWTAGTVRTTKSDVWGWHCGVVC